MVLCACLAVCRSVFALVSTATWHSCCILARRVHIDTEGVSQVPLDDGGKQLAPYLAQVRSAACFSVTDEINLQTRRMFPLSVGI